MLKAVGASGRVSLGKRFAGQWFELICHPDGRVELLPKQIAPVLPGAERSEEQASDEWLPPGGYSKCNEWALRNRSALEAYARRIDSDGTAAEQLQIYMASQSDSAQPV